MPGKPRALGQDWRHKPPTLLWFLLFTASLGKCTFVPQSPFFCKTPTAIPTLPSHRAVVESNERMAGKLFVNLKMPQKYSLVILSLMSCSNILSRRGDDPGFPKAELPSTSSSKSNKLAQAETSNQHLLNTPNI